MRELELMEKKQSKLSISIVILGAVATDPVKEGIKYLGPEFRALVKARYVYPVDINIVQSVTRRDKLTFYPSFLKYARILYFFFPEYMEWFFQRQAADFLRE